MSPGPGKNGDTINGRVQPESWAPDEVSSPSTGDRPNLQVHLALGDRSTRYRRAWASASGDPVQAEPLGFAADPRWVWHEIGHVILMARLGELEFRFAHSMGDALAAIVHDPKSMLARDPDWRGYTFPWVFTPRRHDRCVLHGWGWSGTLGRDLRERADPDRLRMKGYWTEQILSTSLFRLYRCLGGDTVDPNGDPDESARVRASDITIYLILHGLNLTSDPRIVPSNFAESYADNLSHADEGTILCPTSGGSGYVGGCATKVVRWAFQAQGMFPPTPQPSPTSLFCSEGGHLIADLRPTQEILPAAAVEHGPGSYVPVSLDWGDLPGQNPGSTVPQWFASPAAMQIANGQVEVTVANCGRVPAAGTSVTLWRRDWPNGDPPLWNDGYWVSVGTAGPQTIGPGGSSVFQFPEPAPGTRSLLLAEATCPADRSITDPAGLLSCSTNMTPLNELVAGDNNLGLMLVE